MIESFSIESCGEGIKFCCSDNVILHLSRKDCERCGTLKTMLSNTSDDNDEPVPLIKSSTEMKMLQSWLSDGILPPEVDQILQLLIMADFLEVQELISMICTKIAEMVDGKTPSQIKVMLESTEIEEQKPITPLERAYDGKDSNLQVSRKDCYNMCGNPTTQLLICVGCRQMKYCSKECQKDDWESHKRSCKAIRSAKVKMDKEKAKLIREEGNEIFEDNEHMGHFWGYVTPRDYCRARYHLATCYLDMAQEEEHAHMYEEGLKHFMELMRLIHGDNMGLRSETVFVLINLNRDEDSYNFIKWWLTIDPDGRYDWGDPPESKEGDWLWLTGQDRFEDPSGFYSGKYVYVELAFSVAMLIMKFRIMAKHVTHLQQFEAVAKFIENDERWKGLMGMLGTLKTYIVGDKEHIALMEHQEKHIDFLLGEISKHNSIFLKAALEPGPLKSQPPPHSYSKGSAEEAWMVLNKSCRILHRIPGAVMRIRAFFAGADISYNPSFHKYAF